VYSVVDIYLFIVTRTPAAIAYRAITHQKVTLEKPSHTWVFGSLH